MSQKNPSAYRFHWDYFFIALFLWFIAFGLIGEFPVVNAISAGFALLGVFLVLKFAIRRLTVSEMVLGGHLKWQDIPLPESNDPLTRRLKSEDWCRLAYDAHEKEDQIRATVALGEAEKKAKRDMDWFFLAGTYKELGEEEAAAAAYSRVKDKKSFPEP